MKETKPNSKCDHCKEQFDCSSEDGVCPARGRDGHSHEEIDYDQVEASIIWMQSDKE